MKLELAVAETCLTSGCHVRLMRAGGSIQAAYSASVQDKIKVRPGDLVAVDTDGTTPEVVWRWWAGTVERVSAGTAVVSRNVTQSGPEHPRRASSELPLSPEVEGFVAAGDTVFYGSAIVAVARQGVPERAEQLAQRLLPVVVDALAGSGG
jgi:hypothetical protein